MSRTLASAGRIPPTPMKTASSTAIAMATFFILFLSGIMILVPAKDKRRIHRRSVDSRRLVVLGLRRVECHRLKGCRVALDDSPPAVAIALDDSGARSRS